MVMGRHYQRRQQFQFGDVLLLKFLVIFWQQRAVTFYRASMVPMVPRLRVASVICYDTCDMCIYNTLGTNMIYKYIVYISYTSLGFNKRI